MNQLQESLSKCTVVENTLFLPTEMLPNYAEVKSALLKAGAKYKRNTFVFPGNAQPYIDRLMGGEKVNLKKEFQFFATPQPLAKRMVELAQVSDYQLDILEPSAGHGVILKAIEKVRPGGTTWVCELMDENISVLNGIDPEFNFIRKDFLEILGESPEGDPDGFFKDFFDRIIANPPFTKNQDIDHVYKMYECLKPGGRIVTLTSTSWAMKSSRKQIDFCIWLDRVDAEIEELPKGTFKESGTNVGAFLIVIDKK